MRYPLFIKKGDTIGYVAPSFGCATEPYISTFNNALKKLGRKGFGQILGPNCYASAGCGISNHPRLCAEELMEAYESEDSQVLFSCGGGELMCEILPFMDFDRIRKAEPKWFMGFSDNTNFTFLNATICDTASVYGNNAPSFGMERWHASLKDSLALLMGEQSCFHSYPRWELEGIKDEEHPLLPYHTTEKTRVRAFMGEKEADVSDTGTEISMEGRLIGGCLDCLSTLVGTKFDQVEAFQKKYKKDGIIWFLEACDLNPMGVRRALWQLKNAGWFDGAAGFLIGRPYSYGDSVLGLDHVQAVTGVLGELKVPIFMDVDFGHLPPRIPMVEGATARMSCAGSRFTIEYTWK